MRKGKSMITSSSRPVAFLRAGLLLSCLALGGCVNLGGAEPPESLLTLTPTTSAPAGAAISAARGEALALHEPVVPAELDVLRVPVRIDDASLAYLKDAVWVERPAQLFRRLLAETIRTQSERVVLAGGDPAARGSLQMRGSLSQFGYDATQSAVIVRFDATLLDSDGVVRQQRFEAIEAGVLADAASVGPALNSAANDVARQVADWLE